MVAGATTAAEEARTAVVALLDIVMDERAAFEEIRDQLLVGVEAAAGDAGLVGYFEDLAESVDGVLASIAAVEVAYQRVAASGAAPVG